MKVYSIIVNDYGYGDCQRALVAANDSDEAYKLLKKEGHIIDDTPSQLPNVEYKGEEPLIIELI